jgi:hypothetical protein
MQRIAPTGRFVVEILEDGGTAGGRRHGCMAAGSQFCTVSFNFCQDLLAYIIYVKHI